LGRTVSGRIQNSTRRQDHISGDGTRSQPADLLRVDGEARNRQGVIAGWFQNKKGAGILRPRTFSCSYSLNQRLPNLRRIIPEPNKAEPRSMTVDPTSGTTTLVSRRRPGLSFPSYR